MDKKGEVISPETAILAIMSDAAYCAHRNGGEKGDNSRERVNNYFAKAAKKFPGLAQ